METRSRIWYQWLLEFFLLMLKEDNLMSTFLRIISPLNFPQSMPSTGIISKYFRVWNAKPTNDTVEQSHHILHYPTILYVHVHLSTASLTRWMKLWCHDWCFWAQVMPVIDPSSSHMDGAVANPTINIVKLLLVITAQEWPSSLLDQER